MSPTVLVTLLGCLLGQAAAAKLNLASEAKVEWCIEATGAGAASVCYKCHRSRAPVYATPEATIKECKATSVGAAAVTGTGDANCARADGQWCIECKPGFWFDANYKCVTSQAATPAARALENCQKITNNPDCAACNPDWTCTKCRNNLILMAANAIYINAGYWESKCYNITGLNAEARSITWMNAVVPPNCIEVDSEFKCNRCKDGYSLTDGACKLYASGNKCAPTVRYRQYCARCNAVGTACIQCNGSRSIANGACSLPCRQLYGIGCRGCGVARCIERDPVYANGRR